MHQSSVTPRGPGISKQPLQAVEQNAPPLSHRSGEFNQEPLVADADIYRQASERIHFV